MYRVLRVFLKGVGPSTTLAWPGWKQPDIPEEVDTARLKTSTAGLSCTEPVGLGVSFFEGGLSAEGE
jgi:hypothetical protein